MSAVYCDPATGPGRWSTAAFCCALGAAAATAFSIAVAQILLGAALAAMLAGRLRWRLPAHWPALAIFFAWTLASIAASDVPKAGLPQIRKFFAYTILFVVLATFRTARHTRWLTLMWLGGGTASAIWGLRQFYQKWSYSMATQGDFYRDYVSHRITGLNSHWMTFSGQLMLAILFGLALLLWGRPARWWRAALVAGIALMVAALALAFTRGMWIATGCGALYLLWCWRRWAVLLLPVAAAVVFFFGPQGLRDRVNSFLHPRGTLDSNLHRVYTFRTGVEMIKAHPLFGMGPQRVGAHFDEYIPKDLSPEKPDGYYEHLHNIYIHFAAERGVPAIVALLWFLLAQGWQWWRALRRAAPEDAWVYRAAIASLAAVLIGGLFEHNLGDSEVLMMTLSFVGAASATVLSAPPEQAA